MGINKAKGQNPIVTIPEDMKAQDLMNFIHITLFYLEKNERTAKAVWIPLPKFHSLWDTFLSLIYKKPTYMMYVRFIIAKENQRTVLIKGVPVIHDTEKPKGECFFDGITKIDSY